MVPPADDPNVRGRLEPTRPATLAVAALVTTAVAWITISNGYRYFPTPLPWLPALTLAGLAIVEAYAATSTKSRIDRKPGTPAVAPLVVARYVVLAKASALAGALFGGFYLGMTTWLLAQRGVLSQADADLPQAAAGTAGSVLLVLAATWLERSCRVPTPPRRGEPDQRRSRPENDGPNNDGPENAGAANDHDV